MGIISWLNSISDKLRNRKIENDYSDFKLVKTTMRHIKAIHAIEKECFSEPWSIYSLKNEINHPQSICLAAIGKNGSVYGHLTLHYVLDEGNINNIAVRPAARRHGIGRKLIEEAVSKSRAIGITSISLEVRTKNLAAISLYESLGFVTRGLRKNYYKKPIDDALIMWKNCD